MGIGANLISTKSPMYESSGKPAATERIDQHVVAHAPDLLVISYGLNDARGGTPLELFCSELRELLSGIRARIEPLILLAGPYYCTHDRDSSAGWGKATTELFAAYNQAIREIAEETDCLFADLLAAYQGADWMIHSDGVHANDLGHRVIANRMFEVLAANCSGLARESRALEQHIPPWRDESMLRAELGYEGGIGRFGPSTKERSEQQGFET
jgi:hypothetical protein